LSVKQFLEDGAATATANAQFARHLCVLGIMWFPLAVITVTIYCDKSKTVQFG